MRAPVRLSGISNEEAGLLRRPGFIGDSGDFRHDTCDPSEGGFWVELLMRPLTPDVGREQSEFSSALAATRRRRSVRWLSDPHDASLEAGKGSRREVAVILNHVPAGLDAAHVGFVFIDVMGNGH